MQCGLSIRHMHGDLCARLYSCVRVEVLAGRLSTLPCWRLPVISFGSRFGKWHVSKMLSMVPLCV